MRKIGLGTMARRAWVYIYALVSKAYGMKAVVYTAFVLSVVCLLNALYFLGCILVRSYGIEIDILDSLYGLGVWSASAILFYAFFRWLTRIEARS